MKAIFLDRDDTIIVNKDYLHTPDGIEFLPNAIAGLQAFRDLGYQLIVLTDCKCNDILLIHLDKM